MERGEAAQHQHCLLLGGKNPQAFGKEGKNAQIHPAAAKQNLPHSGAQAGEVTGVG